MGDSKNCYSCVYFSVQFSSNKVISQEPIQHLANVIIQHLANVIIQHFANVIIQHLANVIIQHLANVMSSFRRIHRTPGGPHTPQIRESHTKCSCRKKKIFKFFLCSYCTRQFNFKNLRFIVEQALATHEVCHSLVEAVEIFSKYSSNSMDSVQDFANLIFKNQF